MARGQEVLGDGVLLARQQLASGNADQLDGNAPRLAVRVRLRVAGSPLENRTTRER